MRWPQGPDLSSFVGGEAGSVGNAFVLPRRASVSPHKVHCHPAAEKGLTLLLAWHRGVTCCLWGTTGPLKNWLNPIQNLIGFGETLRPESPPQTTEQSRPPGVGEGPTSWRTKGEKGLETKDAGTGGPFTGAAWPGRGSTSAPGASLRGLARSQSAVERDGGPWWSTAPSGRPGAGLSACGSLGATLLVWSSRRLVSCSRVGPRLGAGGTRLCQGASPQLLPPVSRN